MAERDTSAFLSETLFHFLGNASADVCFEVFRSIVARGLLLTVGNKSGELDKFSFGGAGSKNESFEVMQQARVCFTDIPEDKLAHHCQNYGRFALGFSRKTIIAWGGSQVIYVPNRANSGSLQEAMTSTLYGLHRAALLVEAFNSLMTGGLRAVVSPALSVPDDLPLTVGNTTLTGKQRDEYIEHARQSIYRVLSFAKEMSSPDVDDFRYLYEREWRIVAGARLPAQDPYRPLTQDEIVEFGCKCPRWKNPLTTDAALLAKYPHNSALERFLFFNGLNGISVSKQIDTILVPDNEMQNRVTEHIRQNADKFRSDGPMIRVLPAVTD